MIPLLPSKHISLNATVIGLGALVLAQVGGGKTIDQIWKGVRGSKATWARIPDKITFNEVLLTVDFLFMIGAVKVDASGVIVYATA